MSRGSAAPRALVVVGTGGVAAVAPPCSTVAGAGLGPRGAVVAVSSISAAAAPSLAAAVLSSVVAPVECPVYFLFFIREPQATIWICVVA